MALDHNEFCLAAYNPAVDAASDGDVLTQIACIDFLRKVPKSDTFRKS